MLTIRVEGIRDVTFVIFDLSLLLYETSSADKGGSIEPLAPSDPAVLLERGGVCSRAVPPASLPPIYSIFEHILTEISRTNTTRLDIQVQSLL